MRKAIILTYAPITDEEAKLLKNTDVFKIACNTYRAELKPNVRLTADNIVDKCLECDTCPVISVNYDLEKDRVINACYLPQRYSSLIYCLDYLYLNNYTDVLLVATNLVNNNKPSSKGFQEENINGVDSHKGDMYIYKYSIDGVFNVPTVTIKEFLEMNDTEFMPLTEEDKLLGRTEPRRKTLLEKCLFTDACRFEVHTEGKDNKSIVNGDTVADILPADKQAQLMSGELEIVYNNIVIRRITQLVPSEQPKEEVREEVKEEVNIDSLNYQELLAYCKENNIKTKSNKKADLLDAIKGNK